MHEGEGKDSNFHVHDVVEYASSVSDHWQIVR